LSTADVIVFDQSNDAADDTADIEAFVRLTYAAGQRLVGIINPAFDATTDDQIDIPYNLTSMNQVKAVLDAYGVRYVDGYTLLKAHVTGGGHITDWMTDVVHWNATGHAVIESYLDDILPTGGSFSLAGRIYPASEDMENTPLVIDGADEDSRTGTWTEDGTSISSSEADATITYSGTFRKFGIKNSIDTYPTVSFTIDGGDPVTGLALSSNGYDIGTRGAHTIVITVVTSLQIDEFWAI
jgi:hypothetical protein